MSENFSSDQDCARMRLASGVCIGYTGSTPPPSGCGSLFRRLWLFGGNPEGLIWSVCSLVVSIQFKVFFYFLFFLSFDSGDYRFWGFCLNPGHILREASSAFFAIPGEPAQVGKATVRNISFKKNGDIKMARQLS